jgi:hypothetical protein
LREVGFGVDASRFLNLPTLSKRSLPVQQGGGQDLGSITKIPRSYRANKKSKIFFRIDFGFFLSGTGSAGPGNGLGESSTARNTSSFPKK